MEDQTEVNSDHHEELQSLSSALQDQRVLIAELDQRLRHHLERAAATEREDNARLDQLASALAQLGSATQECTNRCAEFDERWQQESPWNQITHTLGDLYRSLQEINNKVAASISMADVQEHIELAMENSKRGGDAAAQQLKDELTERLAMWGQQAQELADRGQVDSLATELQQLKATLEIMRVGTEQAQQTASRQAEELQIRLLRAERALRARTSGPSLPRVPFDYFLFEQRFRGSVADIKARQATYADLFAGRKAVADLGCGRGEFVELLGERGINITGVDNNEDMIDFCRERGLPVVHADLITYLRERSDSSLDGIFISQVVEHLPPPAIWDLIVLCSQKLANGGLILLETINPQCAAAMKWFYLDPTHVRPVVPDLLHFMLQQAEFADVSFIFSSPTSGSEREPALRCGSPMPEVTAFYQDYAVVGVRS
jgi:2-polyprenyl-3-methyl-5-hydroxy-6-metoxy-1,4-benzoquinol methylase